MFPIHLRLFRWAALLLFCAVAGGLLACGQARDGGQAQPGASGRKTIVTTSTITADWMQQVAGEHFEVRSLLPRGSDPHAYTPGPRDVATVASADLVVTIGLGYETAWFTKLVKTAAVDQAKVFTLGDFVQTIAATEGHDHEEDGEGEEPHGDDVADPHFWLDPREAKRLLPVIAERLGSLTPSARDALGKNAGSYAKQLDDLHAWIVQQTASVPAERRLLVTAHESLGYFAHAYGFRLAGSVIPGISTTREPSAAELAELVKDIRQLRAPAIFGETILDARLARRVAEETGAKLVTGLHTDSLGPAGSATGDYLNMMRTTSSTIVNALR